MHFIETEFLRLIVWVYDAIGWPGVILLTSLESVIVPLPSELVLIMAGWLLIQAKGGPWWWVFLAGFYGALGNLIGSWLAYWICLKGGRPLLFKYGKYVLVTPQEIQRSEVWFAKHGEWAVFFARMLPVARSLISIPAGLARMNFWRFSVYTLLGSFPWSLGLATGGYFLGENWTRLRDALQPVEIPFLIALALGLAYFFYRRVRAVRAALAETKQAQD